MADLTRKPLHTLRAQLQQGEIRAVDIATDCLQAAESLDPQVHSLLSWDAENFQAEAQAADARGYGADSPALNGLPVGIKDLILVKGQKGSAASRILEDFVSPYTATCVQRLQDAGALPFGRLNMDEFAMGSSTENSAFGPTFNPWDLKRVPGGSSGGSAAAVAARVLPATLGTDTGGSIRQPASFCGITGIKPTYGRISRYGVIAFASSLDQVGPMAQDAQDCAMLLEAMCGQDPFDATTASRPSEAFESTMLADTRSYKIGLPRAWFAAGLDDKVRSVIDQTIDTLQSQGHSFVEIDLPASQYAVGVYYLIATAEASSNLARYDGIRYGKRAQADTLAQLYSRTRDDGFGMEVKRRIMLGTFALSSGYYDAYYGKAQQVRTLIRQDFDTAFASVDLILSPTSPGTAFPLGSRMDDPLQMYLSDIYTISANLAGIPGMSFPAGFADGLPVGAQLLAPAFAESRMLSVAHRFQQETDFHKQEPAIVKEVLA